MEGKFLTKRQRDKLAADTNKTHFQLGSDVGELKNRDEVTYVVPQSTKSLSDIMKASHFELGFDKKPLNSETLSRFLPPQIITAPYLGIDKKDLRKTNYFLGSYKETPKTPLSPSPPVQIEKTMTKQRASAHHFKLGTHHLSPSSTSRLDFKEKKIDSNEKELAENIKKELQKSNFGLGHDPALYLSTKQEDFSKKVQVFEKKTGNLFESSVVLGSDKARYEKNETLKNEKNLNPSENELLKDLRKSHFILGNEKSDYKLSSTYQSGSPLLKQENFMEKVMKKTNLVLGESSKPWKTSYAQAHSASPAPQPQTVRVKNSDKITNFVLGSTSPTPCTSVHRSDFQQFSSPKEKNNGHAEYIRKHHYQLGTFKSTFRSQNANYGQNAFSCSPSQKIEPKSTHFYLGSEKNFHFTTNQDNFKGIKGSKVVVEKKNEREMVRLKDSVKNDWKTEQRARFEWIKPVADDFYKFSME
jgi:hypothetical protein